MPHAGALNERTAFAESLENACEAQKRLLREREETLEEACGEVDRLRNLIDEESRRFEEAQEAFEAQAAAKELVAAKVRAQLENAAGEIETLKVGGRAGVSCAWVCMDVWFRAVFFVVCFFWVMCGCT